MSSSYNLKRLENISNIKTCMMILVVFYHACMFYTGHWFIAVMPAATAEYCRIFAKWLNTFHVQTFTFASGYLFYYLRYENKKYRETTVDIKNRFQRLILPYIFACIFWVVPIHYLFFKTDVIIIIKNYVLGYSPSQLWFLLMLFWVFIFFYCFSDRFMLSKNNFVILFLLSVAGRILPKIGLGIFQISTALQYLIYFYIGGIIYMKSYKPKAVHTLDFSILSIVLYTLWTWLSVKNGIVFKVAYILLEPIVSIAGIMMAFSIITLLTKKSVQLNKKFEWIICRCDRNSFGIYLFHQQLIYFSISLLNGRVHPVVLVIASFVFALVGSNIIVEMLRKFKITKIMFGL